MQEKLVTQKQTTKIKTQITVKLLIRDTPREDKPPNKGQAESTLVSCIHTQGLKGGNCPPPPLDILCPPPPLGLKY